MLGNIISLESFGLRIARTSSFSRAWVSNSWPCGILGFEFSDEEK
jgi:hypothetical protein